MEQVTVADPPAPKPVRSGTSNVNLEPVKQDGVGATEPLIDVLLTGKRLQITADLSYSLARSNIGRG
jgi:hypothetical protein